MGMPMSERPNASYTQPDALAHAGEVAQWAVMLLGWLWLGEQGMRLGWSVASGVLAVVLWWAARLMCRGSAWALQAGAWRMGVCGLLTACGVWLPSMLAAWDMAHWGLLLVALLWGAHAVATKDIGSFEEMIAKGKRMALRHGFGTAGSKLVALAGVPFGTPGSTNLLHVVTLSGDELSRHASQPAD